jgi:hypothetical protein
MGCTDDRDKKTQVKASPPTKPPNHTKKVVEDQPQSGKNQEQSSTTKGILVGGLSRNWRDSQSNTNYVSSVLWK